MLGQLGEGRIFSYEAIASPGRLGSDTQCQPFVQVQTARCATTCAVGFGKTTSSWLDCSTSGFDIPSYKDVFTPTFTCGTKPGRSNTAAIVGGVVGGVAGLVLLAGLIVFFAKCGRNDNAETPPASNVPYGYPSAGVPPYATTSDTSYPATGAPTSPAGMPVPAVAAWASAPTPPPIPEYDAAVNPGYNHQPYATPTSQ
jgi:hypothetical protein